jgi:DNA-binding NarL/FixJ family response regulator
MRESYEQWRLHSGRMVARERGQLEEPHSVYRVLIVDDHAGFRRCARELLTSEGFTVVGEAGDGEEAVRAAAASTADFVLVDVQLPDTDGFALAERLLSMHPDRPVVLVSSRDRSDYGGLIDASGARGFLSKDELSGDSLRGLLE